MLMTDIQQDVKQPNGKSDVYIKLGVKPLLIKTYSMTAGNLPNQEWLE